MRNNIVKYTHRSTGETILVCEFEGYYENEEEKAFILPNGKILSESELKQKYSKTDHED